MIPPIQTVGSNTGRRWAATLGGKRPQARGGFFIRWKEPFFWAELAPIARALVILAALVVDGFAMPQYRAAGASGMLASRA